jgi:cyanophycinase
LPTHTFSVTSGMPSILLVLALVPVAISSGFAGAQTNAPRAPDELAPLAGPVLLAGGGPLAPAVLSAFVDLAGGGTAHIVVLSGDGKRGKELDWAAAGASTSIVLTAKRAGDLAEADALDALLRADGIWLAALPEKLYEAPLLRTMLENALARGAAVGGAGADAIALTGAPGARDGGRLGLVPRVELIFGAQDAGNDDTHHKAATKLPARVVVAMPDGSALAIHRGRRVALLGEGDVGFAVKRAGNVLVRESVVDARSQRDRGDPLPYHLDLLSWVRTARAAELPLFPPQKPEAPRVLKGALLLHGGGAVSDATWQQFVDLAGGADASIVCIPSADTMENDAEPISFSAERLEKHGCKSVRILHASGRERAEHDAAFVAAIDKANGVWIDGGRTYRFMDRFEATAAHAALRRVLERGGVVAGSSAGAQVIGELLVRGNPKTNDELTDPGYLTGLGLLPGVVIDAHFRDRDRTAEFGALVAKQPQLLGFGIDVDTALVIQGTLGEVLGKGLVTVFDHRGGTASAEGLLLKDGARYDLVTGKSLD